MYFLYIQILYVSVFLQVWSSSKASVGDAGPPLKREPPSADSPCHSQGKGKRSRRAGCVVVGREGVFVTAL